MTPATATERFSGHTPGPFEIERDPHPHALYPWSAWSDGHKLAQFIVEADCRLFAHAQEMLGWKSRLQRETKLIQERDQLRERVKELEAAVAALRLVASLRPVDYTTLEPGVRPDWLRQVQAALAALEADPDR